MEQVLETRRAGNHDAPRRGSPERNWSLWLDDQIARAQREVTTQVVTLEPSLARVLLARNPNNRKMSDATVTKYARDMANGTWAFNGEPVIVSKTGELNDGQHRCEAVLAADKAIQVIFVVGTERDTRLTVDQGKTRVAGDYLGMSGHHDSLALAAMAKYVWQHREHGKLSQQGINSPTKTEVLMLVENTPGLEQSLSAISKKGSDSVGGRSILAFCHWTFAERSKDSVAANEFMDSLIVGSNLTSNSPILYSRNRLMAMRGRLRPNEKAELIFRAWNAHRRGETPRTMPILGGGLPAVER